MVRTSPVDEKENDLVGEDWKTTEAEENAEETVGTVLTDSRRRKMLKRGETIPEPSKPPEKKDRPTPSSSKEVKESGNVLTNTFGGLTEYFRETMAELRRVTWPSREDVNRLTGIVLWVTAITAVLLGIISYLFSFLTQQITSASVGTVAGILAVTTVIVVAFAWLFSDRFTGTRS